MIAPINLSTLQSASAVKIVASTAIVDHLQAAVARAINTAANTGEFSVAWNGYLSEAVKTELQTQGYKVVQSLDGYMRPIDNMYRIEWK